MMIVLSIVNISFSLKSQNQTEAEKRVDSIFLNYQNEIFNESSDLNEASGWIMELPSGKSVIRSFLMYQADTIISLGNETVPHLFKWVMNDELYIRYIAVYALQQITGISPYIPYFDKEDPDGNRQKAIKAWNEWWENNKSKD